MNKDKKLYFDVLSNGQKILWKRLKDTPGDFVLYGGTALALQLGHRMSVDFDFFSNRNFMPEEILKETPYLKNPTIQQSKPNTLSCTVVVINNSAVQVSFFGDLELPKINEPITVDGVKIASCEDVLTTKLKTIINRAFRKDYLDLAAGFEQGYSISKLLKNTKKLYGSNFNYNLSLKALGYFNDIKGLDEKTKQIITQQIVQYEQNKEIKINANFYR